MYTSRPREADEFFAAPESSDWLRGNAGNNKTTHARTITDQRAVIMKSGI